MKKYFRNILSAALALMMVCSVCSNARAEAPLNTEEPGEHCAAFSLSRLEEEGRLQYTVIEPDGSEATVGIEKIHTLTRGEGETWRVWYSGINHKSEFYMTVSNNKVTSVYDYSISLFGASYEDAKLTKATTYGKLTYTMKSVAGIFTTSCWLKGTVTGENDEIDVTWSM